LLHSLILVLAHIFDDFTYVTPLALLGLEIFSELILAMTLSIQYILYKNE